jgi:SAM-dependent methyltransferase
MLTRFSIDADCFCDKRLLEVGCGPQGFSAGLVQLAKKQPETHVIVDPLLHKYQQFSTFSLFGKKTIKITALGEDLPVPSDFFDIVVCQNVLDHVYKPLTVVDEIHRTLKKGGVALISVHTVPSLFKPFGPVIRKIDNNHPYHFTRRKVLCLFDEFEIAGNHSLPLYKDNPELMKGSPENLKLFLAARFLSTTYIKARKA